MKVVEEIQISEEEIAEEAKRSLLKKGELVGKEKSFKDMAEVRMVMYVVPVAIVIALISYFLGR
jgi:hypothetical protein